MTKIHLVVFHFILGDIYAKPVTMLEAHLNDLKKVEFESSTPIDNGILTDTLKSFSVGPSNMSTMKHQGRSIIIVKLCFRQT